MFILSATSTHRDHRTHTHTHKHRERERERKTERERERERANMHCQGIAYTRSFNMGLTSAECQKLECFKIIPNYNV